MGQPYCRTCPFIDLRPVEGSLTPGIEGLCRALPDTWRKVRLDYDWCGSHPEIDLASPHQRMIRAINEAPPRDGDTPEDQITPPALPPGQHGSDSLGGGPRHSPTLPKLFRCAKALTGMTDLIGPTEGDVAWDVAVALNDGYSTQYFVEQFGYLVALVDKLEEEILGDWDWRPKKAKDPATPGSDGA